jgi:hypothetical protein
MKSKENSLIFSKLFNFVVGLVEKPRQDLATAYPALVLQPLPPNLL